MIGLGYIGLPTAAIIARAGLSVRGVDISQRIVDVVNAGKVHIQETDLDALVRNVVADGVLTASTEAPVADVYLIAVPTPLGDNKAPDISMVLDAARLIAPVLPTGGIVILESTSPVGTTKQMASVIAEMRPDLAVPGFCEDQAPDVHIAYCPERVLPGRIIEELVANDRIIGGLTESCALQAQKFYRRFVRGDCINTTSDVAEMVKLTENSFRDVNIAFANELSLLAEHMGIDVWEVVRLANRHPRVNVLQPGPGVGGHCIAVDPWFLVSSAPEHARLIRTAREVNDAKPDHVVNRLTAMLDGNPDASIALLGLAFKPNIDDFRESPALEIADRIARKYGDRVLVVEPYTDELPGDMADHGAQLTTYEEAMAKAELVAVLVDHDAFRSAPRYLSANKIVYDTRGMWAQ
ncbi:UDP-N-acetyl-D-mannosamine dehydrogenase [Aurantiacibacter sp. MUD11]|uniref:UDP-N-acetyl-D-mannosamine dehydrogenase n=1 Tax=Aurantiacibacter sp. MUD11 TaxID=3003265 RepID=UPI0022AA35B4|nr:UDP-N-acetyl-D-mannosamine dehydrogenase [Aurantiacibacter sp. MUD11]WAT19332.1 UDP-N-acetyl-D-mannosamine dehydrogenase [Aurantiacibacter sp. MUD11]